MRDPEGLDIPPYRRRRGRPKGSGGFRRSRRMKPLCGRSIGECSCLGGYVLARVYGHRLERLVGTYLANPDLGDDIVAQCCEVTPACLRRILQKPEARKLQNWLKANPECVEGYRLVVVDDEGSISYAGTPPSGWSYSLL